MSMSAQEPSATPTEDTGTFHCWYCPALGAYRKDNQPILSCWEHLLTRFKWIPLHLFEPGTPIPEGWTLRSYYIESENGYYGSHRTIPEKNAAAAKGLYAPPGATGNESAGHVPPKPR